MHVVREKEGVPRASRYIGGIEFQGLLHLLRGRCWIMAVGQPPYGHLRVRVGKGGVERQRTLGRAPYLRTRRRRRHEVIGRVAPRVGQRGPRVGVGRVERDRGFGVPDGGTERGGRELVRLEPGALHQFVRFVAGRAAPPVRVARSQLAMPMTRTTAAAAAAIALHRREPARDALRDGAAAVPVGVIPPPGVVMSSSACTTSLALCGRSAGRFSRQRITSAASAGGSEARRLLIASGASVTCAASKFCGVRPAKGGCPVSSSYASTPTE